MAEPKTALEPGESMLKEGRANLQRGVETVGGRLFLTDRRLIFESHKFNVQRGSTEVPLAQIAELGTAWTKFLGFLPLFPNTMSVRTRGGAEYDVVCKGRGAWIEAIERARGSG